MRRISSRSAGPTRYAPVGSTQSSRTKPPSSSSSLPAPDGLARKARTCSVRKTSSERFAVAARWAGSERYRAASNSWYALCTNATWSGPAGRSSGARTQAAGSRRPSVKASAPSSRWRSSREKTVRSARNARPSVAGSCCSSSGRPCSVSVRVRWVPRMSARGCPGGRPSSAVRRLSSGVAAGSARRTTWKCGTRDGSTPFAYICSTSCSEQ